MKKETGLPTRTILQIDGELCEPDPEDIEARKKIFDSFRTEAEKRHLSNAENFGISRY